MKNTFLIIGLFFMVSCSNMSGEASSESVTEGRQDAEIKWDKVQLEKQFDSELRSFVKCLNNKDYEGSMKYMPEKMFEVFSKDVLLSGLEQMNEMGMAMEFDPFEITSVSDVVLHEKYYYCKIDIKSRTVMTLYGQVALQQDQLIESLKMQGADISVLESGQLDVKMNEFVYAIADQENKSWGYLRMNESDKEQMGIIIPKEVYLQLD